MQYVMGWSNCSIVRCYSFKVLSVHEKKTVSNCLLSIYTEPALSVKTYYLIVTVGSNEEHNSKGDCKLNKVFISLLE